MLTTPAQDSAARVHPGTQPGYPGSPPLLTLCFLLVFILPLENPMKQIPSSSPYQPWLSAGTSAPKPCLFPAEHPGSQPVSLGLGSTPSPSSPPTLSPGYFLLHSLHQINCGSLGLNTTLKLKANISNHSFWRPENAFYPHAPSPSCYLVFGLLDPGFRQEEHIFSERAKLNMCGKS